MGEGEWFARAEQVLARRRARTRRWAVLAEVVKGPVLGGLVLVGLVEAWLSGWELWPLVIGLGAVLVAGLLRIARSAGPVWTSALAVLVADVAWLWWVSPWWWAVLAGVVLTGAASAGAIATRLRTRRREVLGSLGVGLVLLVGGIVGLVLTAAADRAEQERQLQAAHDEAVPKIRPRTANAMVFMLTEQLAHMAQARTHGGGNPGENAQRFCFNFSDTAQRQLADAIRTPDCLSAAAALAGKVSGLDYTNNVSLPASAVTHDQAGRQMVDACRLDFTSIIGDGSAGTPPGPQLGRLTLEQQQGAGQLITAYAPCG